MHLSKKSIIEKALRFYVKKELTAQESILQYAGILDEKEASKMITLIQSSKHNKKIEIDL